jgi:hypothetical protein
MADKVKTAIFGKDLRVTLKDHSLSANGNKINIVPEGAGYFMPEIGPTKFLDWPSYKRYFLFGPRTYKRIFFARKKAAKCVDFGTDEGIVYGPDEEQLKKANLNLLAEKIGQDASKGTPWYMWAILVSSVMNLLLLLQVSGVIR